MRGSRSIKAARLLPPIALAIVFLFFPTRVLRASALAGLAVYALSFAYSALAARSIALRRAEPVLRCFRNEPFEVSLKLENASRFGFARLLVSDLTGPLSARDDGRFLLSLPGRARTTLAYGAVAPERGEFRLGPARLRLSDPLGLFPRDILFEETSALIVYPETRRTGGMPHSGLPQGDLRVADPAYEDPTRFRSIRPYLPGDEMRRINWKASARARKLLTNEYLCAMTEPLMIVLDIDEGSYPQRGRYERIETAIVGAASLVRRAAQLGQSVGFATNGLFWGDILAPPLPPGPGNELAIMDALARVRSRPRPDRAKAPPEREAAMEGTEGILSAALSVRLPGRCRLAYLGPFPGEETVGLLLRARRQGLSPEIHAVDPLSGERASAYARFFPLQAI
jgi:uncharacterized protein (DUF58 family)